MKRWISLILVLLLMVSTAGCGGEADQTVPDTTVNPPVASTPTLPEQTTPAQTDAPQTSEPTTPPETTVPPTTEPLPPETTEAPTEPTENPWLQEECPEIDNLLDLRDYMNARIANDELVFSFYFTGDAWFDAQKIAQMTSACYIYYEWQGNRYQVTVTEYPGDRMVDAYFSGDYSGLNQDEMLALNIAIDAVNTAKAQAKDEWELERILHDMLADSITYFDGNRDFHDPENPPRNLTAVGALLDHQANCQGYADAFYVLGSIAGFRVGRMNVETPSDLHVTNTILLDGAWYVVDVTFDDQAGDASTNYRLFNAGLDQIREYTWAEEKEIHPIAQTSPEAYYYFHEGIVFSDAAVMAEYITNRWTAHGEIVVEAMLEDESNGDIIDSVLYDALTETGRPFFYTYWYFFDGTDLYYTVIFS